MATKKNWVAGVVAKMVPGALHRALHVPMGQKIPMDKLRAAAKKPGVTGRRARLAITMRGFKHGGK
jgi:hypothetical protein